MQKKFISGARADSNLTINSYDPEYGVYIGELPDPSDADIKGRVYIVNETTLQIINFTYNGKAPGELNFSARLKITIILELCLSPFP